ncbi:MAG: hypothetical protein ACRCWR_03595 [Saezia sp.]
MDLHTSLSKTYLNVKECIENNNFNDALSILRELYSGLQKDKPMTIRQMKSVQYSNVFLNETLKQIALTLDLIHLYLAKNKSINSDAVAGYFNGVLIEGEIVKDQDFEKKIVLLDIKSLLYALHE